MIKCSSDYFHYVYRVFFNSFGRVFQKLRPLKKRCPAGGRRVGRRECAGHRASSEVNLLVNLFSKLYVTFILQLIAFKFGRDKEEDQ